MDKVCTCLTTFALSMGKRRVTDEGEAETFPFLYIHQGFVPCLLCRLCFPKGLEIKITDPD